jgi:hypothetical protein
MSLKLGGHLFTGPFAIDTTEVRANQVPVVYAVIAKGGPSWAPVFRVVDIGASPDEGLRFAEARDRANWSAAPDESLSVYLFYARRADYSATDRQHLVDELSQRYKPPADFVE